LFRQKTRGDWAAVIARVAAELQRYAAGDLVALAPEKDSN
jgi:hypothetical protein